MPWLGEQAQELKTTRAVRCHDSPHCGAFTPSALGSGPNPSVCFSHLLIPPLPCYPKVPPHLLQCLLSTSSCSPWVFTSLFAQCSPYLISSRGAVESVICFSNYLTDSLCASLSHEWFLRVTHMENVAFLDPWPLFSLIF